MGLVGGRCDELGVAYDSHHWVGTFTFISPTDGIRTADPEQVYVTVQVRDIYDHLCLSR